MNLLFVPAENRDTVPALCSHGAMRWPFLPLLLLAATLHGHGPGAKNDFEGRRVLLIGIDGTRADALQKLIKDGRAPNLKSLVETGSVTWNGYTGGEPNAAVPQDTVSGPSWTTILTGVWRDKHGVADNRFRGERIAQHPHFMRLLKNAKPTAYVSSFCNWPEIHAYIVGSSERNPGEKEQRPFLDFHITGVPDARLRGTDYPELDAKVAAEAIKHLGTANPDAMFLYFGAVDETGHGKANPDGAFSPDNAAYLAALAKVDGHLGEVLAALRARPQYAEEKWLILATTDHGGRDKNHGGQTPEERTIWIIASGGGVPRGAVVPGPVPQTAIAPTIFRHLGVPAPADWTAKPFALPANP